MTKNERTISFLNNYFIYKKRRNVDAETIAKNAVSQTIDDEIDQQEANTKINDIITETRIQSANEVTDSKTTTTKTKKKVTLAENSEEKPKKKKIRRKINVSNNEN